VQALAEYNDGVRYLMTVIDTFTRYAFVRMLSDKSGPTVLAAFKHVLNEAKEKPHILVLDRGTEFTNKNFVKFCNQNNIKIYTPDTSIHAAYIERFNRSLKLLLYKYLSEFETYRFINKVDKDGTKTSVLSQLVSTYNNRKHRMIQTTPSNAENDPSIHINMRLVAAKNYEKIKPKKQTFKIGDLVRIAMIKNKFSRSFKPQSQHEIFRIIGVRTNLKIPLYVLENYHSNETIQGRFYASQLTKVNSDIFRIEKVLKTKKSNGITQHLVKWKGYDDSYNSWVNDSDIVQQF